MPVRIQRTFDRRSMRRGLVRAGQLWTRLERRWDENPGYVAAATAGTVGILLALSLMISAGIDWANGPPNESPPPLAQFDPDDDLGDPDSDLMRGLRDNDEPPDQVAARSDDFNDEFDDTGDLFLKPKKIGRSTVRQFVDEPVEDDVDDDRPQTRITIVDKAPKRQIAIEDDEDDEMGLESPSRPTLKFEIEESDVVSDADVVEKQVPVDEGDEQSEVGSTVATTEPALLKTNGEQEQESERPAGKRSLEADDDTIRPDARPARPFDPEPIRELHRVRTEHPAPREHSGWQQQRTRIEPPAVAARKSRSAETVVVAPREVRPARPAADKPTTRETRAPHKSTTDTPFKLSISGPATVGLGDACSYELRVTNTGAATARNLVVSVELPPGLVHEVSQSLEQNVDSIPAGGSHRSLLRLRAKHPGQSTIEVDLVDGQRVAVKLTARVQVGSKTTAARVVSSECCCEAIR